MRNTYKPYPCGIVIHAAIDAMLRARRACKLSTTQAIDRIELTVSPSAIALGNRPQPKDDLEAKFSLQHWVAAAAAHGKAGFAEGRPGVVNDPEIARLRSIIHAESDAGLANDAARIKLILANGEAYGQEVEHCVGSLQSPLSDAELETKFLDQVELAIGDARAHRLLAACLGAAQLPDAGEIARLAC